MNSTERFSKKYEIVLKSFQKYEIVLKDFQKI